MLKCKIPELQTNIILKYIEILRKWNHKLNLISKRVSEDDAMLYLHVMDAVAMKDAILASTTSNLNSNPNNCNIDIIDSNPDKCGLAIFDVGAGNGFNGVLLGILLENAKIYMIERKSKIADFLKYICTALSLDNTTCIELDISDLQYLFTLDVSNSVKNSPHRYNKLNILREKLLWSDIDSKNRVISSKAFLSIDHMCKMFFPLMPQLFSKFFIHASIYQCNNSKMIADDFLQHNKSFVLHKHSNCYRNSSSVLEIQSQ